MLKFFRKSPPVTSEPSHQTIALELALEAAWRILTKDSTPTTVITNDMYWKMVDMWTQDLRGVIIYEFPVFAVSPYEIEWRESCLKNMNPVVKLALFIELGIVVPQPGGSDAKTV